MKTDGFSRRDFLGVAGMGLLSTLLPSRANPAIAKAMAELQGRVRITGVKTAVVRSNYTWNYVKILTDSGEYGIGEAFCSPGIPGLVKRYERTLVGQDPLNVEKIYNRLIQSSFSWQSGVSVIAISGIEIALWDLAGKLLKVPCYQLLGGKSRDKVPLYCDGGAPRNLGESSAWRDYAQKMAEKNYVFYKIDIDPVTSRKVLPRDPVNRSISKAELKLMVKLLTAAQDAFGERQMAVDCHGCYDTNDAIRLANAIEDLKVFFLEDPIPAFNVEGYKRVTESTATTICTGENLFGRDDFKPLIVNQACDVFQPDVVKTGGLLESKKISDMADLWNIPVAVHNLSSPVGTVASAHVSATMRNFCGLEFKFERPDWWDDVIIHDKPLYQDGFIELSNKPGLGIELNDEVCRTHKHPDFPYF